MYVEDQSGNIRAYMQQAAEIDINAANYREEAAREQCRPFMLLRPQIFPDGNQWCALYGENTQDGICAFGSTPAQAAMQFDREWHHATCGQAVLPNVPHHCAPADVAALVQRLEALADPAQEPTPSYENTDWRTLTGVSARGIFMG